MRQRNALVRFQADGTLDTTFGIGGIVNDDARSFEKVTVQLDDKILAMAATRPTRTSAGYVSLGIVGAIAVYGFQTALGGRPVLDEAAIGD